MLRDWFAVVCSLLAISITLWVQIIQPRLELKPEVTVRHIISVESDEVLHHYVFRNDGNAPARDLGFLFESEGPGITRMESNKPWHKLIGGEGHIFVELGWKELAPGDSFHVSIGAEKTGVLGDIYPRMFKVWHRGGIVDKYGSGG